MTFLDSAEDPKRAQSRALKLFVLVTLAVGVVSGLLIQPSIPAWYAHLVQPAIAPPNGAFAPVWTALYVLMAYAAWRVWKTAGLRSAEMTAYAVQLALNFAWGGIFFALHNILAALVEVAVLDAAILVTLLMFWRRDRVAGGLMLPYLGWSLFATALNYAFWRLNG